MLWANKPYRLGTGLGCRLKIHDDPLSMSQPRLLLQVSCAPGIEPIGKYTPSLALKRVLRPPGVQRKIARASTEMLQK